MVNLTINGVTFAYPQTGDKNWGSGATGWAQAVTSGMLSKAGGSFTLTAQADFGASFGLKALYLLTETSNPAGTGVLRLARADVISWRNQANGADLPLGVDSSNQLTFNGVPIIPSGGLTASRALVSSGAGAITVSATTATQLALLSSAAGSTGTTSTNLVFSTSPVFTTPRLVNASPLLGVTTSAGTAGLIRLTAADQVAVGDASELLFDGAGNASLTGTLTLTGLTASTVPYLNASKALTSSAVNPTELGYVSGVTSAIQTQLNAKQASGNYITALTGDATASGPGSVAITFATVNSNVGSFGSSTSIPSFTVNAKGLITAASGNVVIAPAGTLTGATLAANVLASSLTSLGTIATGVWHGTVIGALYGGTGGDSSGSTGLAKVASGTWSYATLVNADVNASAAIALSKLATVTASRALASDGSGFISAATTTLTQLNLLSAATGTTGTTSTSIVFSTSPTITTPTFSGLSTFGGNIAFTTTSTQGIVGTTTNDSAATGNVGQSVISTIATGAAVALTTATAKTVTSIALTAGDWDVSIICGLQGSLVGTQFIGMIGTTTDSLTGVLFGNNAACTPTVSNVNSDVTVEVPSFRVSVTGTPTYYLIAYAVFSVGAATAYGRISARRVR